MQRPDGVTGADHLVGSSRGASRVVGVDLDESLQLRLLPLDAGQEGVDEVHRRKPSCRNVGGELVHGAEGQLGVRHVALGRWCLGGRYRALNMVCGSQVAMAGKMVMRRTPTHKTKKNGSTARATCKML